MRFNDELLSALKDLKKITKVDFILSQCMGDVVAATCTITDDMHKNMDLFMNNGAEVWMWGNEYYCKIYEADTPAYILISKGYREDVMTMGKICASQIKHLLNAYGGQMDQETFLKNILLGKTETMDVAKIGKKLHIDLKVFRVVYVIEMQENQVMSSLEMLKQLFAGQSQTFVIALDSKHIVLIKAIKTSDRKKDKELEQLGLMILDMFNSEMMIKVHIGYGRIAECIEDLETSYTEACIALKVGSVFTPEYRLTSYTRLGIGRLIYQLPKDKCLLFLEEVMSSENFFDFDQETLNIANTLLANDLNIAETARQLYLHRNTLVYRIEKIEKMIGLDVRKFEDAMKFKLAFMIHDYIRCEMTPNPIGGE